MNSQSWIPHGLKTTMECISRAVILSQPTDIHEFLLQYLSELVSFRKSYFETDTKDFSLYNHKRWEDQFFRNTRGTTKTSAASPPPSQAEITEALKMLYSDLSFSAEENLTTRVPSQKRLGTKKPAEEDQKPSTTPSDLTPPPPVRKQLGKNVPPTFLVVKGEAKSEKTRRVSSVRFSEELSKGTTNDVMNRQPLPPILKRSSTPALVSASKTSGASKPSSLPRIPVPMATKYLVLPSIPQTEGKDQVSVVRGKAMSPKPKKGSPIKRGMVPESTKDPKRPEAEGKSARHTKPKFPELEENIQPNGSPEQSRRRRIRWTDRERVKPILDRTVEGIESTAFGRPASVGGGSNHLNLAPVSSPNHT